MENGEIICPRRRKHTGDFQELVTKGSCSIIFIVLTLVALRPIMVSQILSRADAYSAFGLVAESKRQCNKALLLDGDNSQAWCQLARIHKTQGNREMAYGAYQKATQADATNKPAHFELGLMYARDDLHRQAIPYFEQVRRLGVDPPEHLQPGGFPYHKASLDMLALCCEKVGDIAKAEFILEEILVFYPGYAKADRRLTELKEQHKD
jgi:tetratricopeptide (TPR) repeat protein